MANNYNNFGELVLIVGDLYISSRASKIPPSFQRMLVPQKMQHVICTGNASAADREHLATLAPNVHVVAGNYDVDSNLPETKVIQVGSFRIGVIHGHQIVPWSSPAAMAGMRRKLCVDILVSGHTHKNQVVTLDDGDFLYINPGSITGAYSPLTKNVVPSFVLLAVQDTKVVCYVYELVNGEVAVSKTELNKKLPEAAVGANPALLESLLK